MLVWLHLFYYEGTTIGMKKAARKRLVHLLARAMFTSAFST